MANYQQTSPVNITLGVLGPRSSASAYRKPPTVHYPLNQAAICLVNKYLLSTYYMTGTVLDEA